MRPLEADGTDTASWTTESRHMVLLLGKNKWVLAIVTIECCCEETDMEVRVNDAAASRKQVRRVSLLNL